MCVVLSDSSQIDGFAKRQFDEKTYSGTQIDFDKEDFIKRVNEVYEANSKQLVDGYVTCHMQSTVALALVAAMSSSCH